MSLVDRALTVLGAAAIREVTRSDIAQALGIVQDLVVTPPFECLACGKPCVDDSCVDCGGETAAVEPIALEDARFVVVQQGAGVVALVLDEAIARAIAKDREDYLVFPVAKQPSFPTSYLNADSVELTGRGAWSSGESAQTAFLNSVATNFHVHTVQKGQVFQNYVTPRGEDVQAPWALVEVDNRQGTYVTAVADTRVTHTRATDVATMLEIGRRSAIQGAERG
jgi:hypothetical protein